MTREISLTQGKVALVDDEDYDRTIQYKWFANKVGVNWYVMARIMNKSIRMHQLLLNPKIGERCDHINGDGLDNRRCNLRIVTHSQNCMNRKKTLNFSSKFKGIHWVERIGKWGASIGINYKTIYLGYFLNEIDAARVYNKAAKELFGEYAWLNIIEELPEESGSRHLSRCE